MRSRASLAPRSCLVFMLAAVACGGGSSNKGDPKTGANAGGDTPPPAEVQQAQQTCGSADKEQTHNLSTSSSTEALTPCAEGNKPNDYSGMVKIETLEQGVHIIINATDDDVTLLGPDVKSRDAVIVYPKGKGSASVEVPLQKTKTGYSGDKIVLWEDLGMTAEGTKIDVAIFDHDKGSGSTEEMHVSLAVSTGRSCEKAQDENMQTMNMTKGGSSKPDLTNDQLGAPMRTSSWFASCGLPDSANADICVAVKKGHVVGASVAVTPTNNRVAACIDQKARGIHFPVSDQLDVVHQKF
jgi:hypothetical protein